MAEMAEISKKKSSVLRVLMLPWLAHGHIFPFLELAKRLTTRNFHVYMCSTPVNLTSIQKKITQKYSDSIELVELRITPSPELPPRRHTTKGLPPHLMGKLKRAYEMSAPKFSDILKSLRPDLVIYDLNQPWAADIAASQRIPAVQFISVSASFVGFCLHKTKNLGKEFPYPEIYLRGYERLFKLQGKSEAQNNDVSGGSVFLQAVDRSHKTLLIKSYREIEGKFIDFLSLISNKNVVPVGPLVQDSTICDDEVEEEEEDRGGDKEIMEWLDQKERNSVVYASFGSEYYLSKDERDAISQGLELSNVNFIWVLRFPSGEEKISVEEVLPEGFLDRVRNRGKVVEGWAPQVKILKHYSTGGFVSHCGWSSIMESMKWGVPIVAMPMHIDQPLNARLVEAVGVGVEAMRDEKGNLRGEEIARVIRKVMAEEGGEDVRRKAKDLSEKLERKGDEEIDALREELVRLCQIY